MKALAKENDDANLPQLTQVLMDSAVRRTQVWTKLRRTTDVARELDWMQSLLKPTPVPPLSTAILEMRRCIPSKTRLGRVEISANTQGLDREDPPGERWFEKSMVKIDGATVGTLDRNGKIVLLLEPGKYLVWLGLRGGGIGASTEFAAEPERPKQVEVGLDTSKAIYHETDAIVTGTIDGLILNSATRLAFEFRNPSTNSRLKLRSIHAIYVLAEPSAETAGLEELFAIQQSRIVVANVQKLRELINAQNKATMLSIAVEDSTGRVWEALIPLRAE